MSLYDILMLAILIGAVVFGAWKGLAWQIASFAAIVVSYFAALKFSEPVAAMLQIEPPWNKFAAMLAIFLGCSLLIWLIFSRVKTAIKKMHMGGFDRQAGALLGAGKGALLCMVVTLFAVTLLGSSARQAIISSRSGGYIARGINRLTAVVPDEIHQVLNPYVQDFNNAIANDPNLNGIPQGQPVGVAGAPGNSNGQNPNGGYYVPIEVRGNWGQPTGTQNTQTYNGSWQTPPIRSANQNNQSPEYPTTPNGQPRGYQGLPNQPLPNQPQGSQPGGDNQTWNWGNPYQGSPKTNGIQGEPAGQGTPAMSQGSNGWPDFSIRINSKEVLDKAINAAKNAAQNSTNGGQ